MKKDLFNYVANNYDVEAAKHCEDICDDIDKMIFVMHEINTAILNDDLVYLCIKISYHINKLQTFRDRIWNFKSYSLARYDKLTTLTAEYMDEYYGLTAA